jgi:hypothetical protein
MKTERGTKKVEKLSPLDKALRDNKELKTRLSELHRLCERTLAIIDGLAMTTPNYGNIVLRLGALQGIADRLAGKVP